MNKRFPAFLMIIAAALLPLFSASFQAPREAQGFDSEVMLSSWDFSPEAVDRAALDEYGISLVVTTKGDEVFTWFGHVGLMVSYPDGERVLFDYGLFSYDDDFYKNFAMGRLWYSMSASYIETDIKIYGEQNRSMKEIPLKLPPEKKQAVLDFLVYNHRPENSRYLYHYYLDNCATRIRDILDYATDGEFRKWAIERGASSTFRKEAARALEVNAFWDYFLNFLQGGRIDKPITLWDEMFLPERLEAAVLEFGLGDGESALLDNTLNDNRPKTLEEYSFIGEIAVPLIISLAISAFFIICAHSGWRTAYGIGGFAVYLVLGLASALLTFMCLFTNHDVAWFNENLLFINPLLLWLAWRNLHMAFKKTQDAAIVARMDRLFFYLAAALVLLKMTFPHAFYQNNLQQIITIAPIYASRAFVRLRRKAPSRPQSLPARSPRDFNDMI